MLDVIMDEGGVGGAGTATGTATSSATPRTTTTALDAAINVHSIGKGVVEPSGRCSQCGGTSSASPSSSPSSSSRSSRSSSTRQAQAQAQALGLAQTQTPCSHHYQHGQHYQHSSISSAGTSSASVASANASAITNGSLSTAAAATANAAGPTISAPAPPGPGIGKGTGTGQPPFQQRPRRVSKLQHRALSATLESLRNAATLDTVRLRVPRTFQSKSTPDADANMEPPVLSFYGTEPVPLPTRFANIKRSLTAGHEAQLEASWARLLDALRDEVEHIEARGPQLIPNIEFAHIDDPTKAAQFARDLKRYGVGLIRGVVPRADAQAAIDETVKYLETSSDFKTPPPQDPTCFDFFWTPAQVRTRAHPCVLEAQRFAMSLWDNDADDRMAIRFPIAYADRLRIHGANIGGVGPDAPDSKTTNGDSLGSSSAAAAAAEAQKAAVELLGDFASSTVIAQVDNGSLERWEPDGYGRGGTYEAIFKGEWERYDPWDPTFRVSSTPDLYNGYGACSIFRMYQGMVALNTIEPGLIRLLPSPKLATAYFLLRPFFSPKEKPPARREGPEWDAFLDASNWSLDSEQSTIIHGAVPGHAQRLTELWHPHLHIRRTLITIPTLQTGDYIVWHPDLAYHITSNPNVMASRAPTPPPMSLDDEEAPSGRPVSVLVYVPAAPLTQTNALYLARQRKTFQIGHPSPDFDATGSGLGSEASHAGRPGENEIAEIGGPAGLQAMGLAPFDVAPTPPIVGASGSGSGSGSGEDGDVEMVGAAPVGVGAAADGAVAGGSSAKSPTRAEAEVARLANIILFPERYDFYMPKRSTLTPKTARVKMEINGDEGKGLKIKR
ncbi:hypothetical protein B0T22DRAFT_480402 [Podospora appendiculata]|uniref:DUF1479 domain protein n=1 Tax=Podospora appendiculata TaxID=314037 RepID=A0AAE0XAM3_9PEZI|nr:hypothetical protein B0T22DRAFT_480402 [Podospora appendiculata]